MTTKQRSKNAMTMPGRNSLARNNRNRVAMKRGAYTTADVVIAVALIAMLAACAGPRLTRASAAKRLPAMVDNLHRMRCQIQLYRIEHDGLLPGQMTPGGGVACDGFINALTESAGGGRAPYLGEIPANPFVADDTADDIAIVNCMDDEPCGGESTGWWFNAASGDFRANDSRFHSVY